MSSGAIAKQQVQLLLRSKWLMSATMLFVLLSLTLVYTGASSATAINDFNRMTASLLNMSLFLVPLLSLLTGSLFIAGEKEDGYLALLFTYPLQPLAFLVGKWCGLFASLSLMVTFGYAISAIVGAFYGLAFSSFLLFYGMTLLLVAMFSAVAVFVGVATSTRFQALSVSLTVWSFFVLFYDWLMIALVTALPKTSALSTLTVALLANPTTLVRVWTITALKSSAVFGASLYDLAKWLESTGGQVTVAVAACTWVIVPLGGAYFSLKRGMSRG